MLHKPGCKAAGRVPSTPKQKELASLQGPGQASGRTSRLGTRKGRPLQSESRLKVWDHKDKWSLSRVFSLLTS